MKIFMKKLFLGEAPRLWKQIIRGFLTVGYKKIKLIIKVWKELI